MEKIKEVVKSYSEWGLFLVGTTILIRPYISVRQTIRDAAITFLVSMLTGFLLEYVDLPELVKYGICGVFGLFAVRFYMIAEAVLKQVEKDPIDFIKHWKDKEDDRR